MAYPDMFLLIMNFSIYRQPHTLIASLRMIYPNYLSRSDQVDFGIRQRPNRESTVYQLRSIQILRTLLLPIILSMTLLMNNRSLIIILPTLLRIGLATYGSAPDRMGSAFIHLSSPSSLTIDMIKRMNGD